MIWISPVNLMFMGFFFFCADEAHKYYLHTVEFGIKAYRAYLEWCEEAKAILGEERK